MENLTQRWTQSGPFFPKSGHFFRFSKRAGEASPLPPSCAPVIVAEYALISLNMPKCLIMAPYASIMPVYASICLNVPEYA